MVMHSGDVGRDLLKERPSTTHRGPSRTHPGLRTEHRSIRTGAPFALLLYGPCPETVNFISELAFCKHVGRDGGGACWRRGTQSACLPPLLARSHIDSETPSTQIPGGPGDKLASAQDSVRTQKASSGVPRNTDKGGPIASFLVPATSPNSQPSMLNDNREGEGMVGGPEFLSLGPTYPWGSRRRAWWDVSALRSETEQRLRRLTWTACMHGRAMKQELDNFGDFAWALNALILAFKTRIARYKDKW